MVADGKKINLQGFGTFEGRARKGRTGRNPRTGEELTIKAKTVPAFSAAKAFKEMVRRAPASLLRARAAFFCCRVFVRPSFRRYILRCCHVVVVTF